MTGPKAGCASPRYFVEGGNGNLCLVFMLGGEGKQRKVCRRIFIAPPDRDP